MSAHWERRRLAVVQARCDAALGAPPGIDPAAFAAACLADTYEVLADLEVSAAIAGGGPEVAELLWPGSRQLPDGTIAELAAFVSAMRSDEPGGGGVRELVVVPADVPDLPGLVLAKIFKVLHRVDVAVAAERGGAGAVAIGLSLPMADWIPPDVLDLDIDPYEALLGAAPDPGRCARTPPWHRMRTPISVHRLDPGLEGWDATRALLSGY